MSFANVRYHLTIGLRMYPSQHKQWPDDYQVVTIGSWVATNGCHQAAGRQLPITMPRHCFLVATWQVI
jgi:hypothetical protein